MSSKPLRPRATNKFPCRSGRVVGQACAELDLSNRLQRGGCGDQRCRNIHVDTLTPDTVYFLNPFNKLAVESHFRNLQVRRNLRCADYFGYLLCVHRRSQTDDGLKRRLPLLIGQQKVAASSSERNAGIVTLRYRSIPDSASVSIHS
jgi:hypothetical protein